MSNLFPHDQETEQPGDLPPGPGQHPLYRQVEQHIQHGNWAAAQIPLGQLLELYPDDRYLQQLMGSARARSALLGHGEVITVEAVPAETPGSNRGLIFAGFVVTLLVCGLISAGLVWFWFWPQDSAQPQAEQIQALREEAQAALSSGDYDRAALAYNQLLRILPDDPQITKELKQVNELRETVSLYSEAIAEMEAQRWQSALTILEQIEAKQPGYRDVAARMEFVKAQEDLANQFSEAEAAFNQADYDTAIPLYEALQLEDYGFNRDIIQNRLFLSYLQSGLAELEAAGQNVQQLEAALEKLEKATSMQPEDSQARNEAQLLRLYLAGLEEFENDGWAPATANLDLVYQAQSDYAGGNAARMLYQAYKAWGDELFTGGQFEQARERYEAASLIRGVADKEEINRKIALVNDALVPPTPTPEPTPTPVPPAAAAGGGAGGAGGSAPVVVLPTPTPTPIPYPYALKSMAVRNNCGDKGYIHGVVWNTYNMPMSGIVIQAFNKTTGTGPVISNPTNEDGIYQIILEKDQIEGLWSVQVLENNQPVSLVWGQHLGGGCQNGAQELKVDWQRELALQ